MVAVPFRLTKHSLPRLPGLRLLRRRRRHCQCKWHLRTGGGGVDGRLTRRLTELKQSLGPLGSHWEGLALVDKIAHAKAPEGVSPPPPPPLPVPVAPQDRVGWG